MRTRETPSTLWDWADAALRRPLEISDDWRSDQEMIVEAEGLTRFRWPGEHSDLFVPNAVAGYRRLFVGAVEAGRRAGQYRPVLDGDVADDAFLLPRARSDLAA